MDTRLFELVLIVLVCAYTTSSALIIRSNGEIGSGINGVKVTHRRPPVTNRQVCDAVDDSFRFHCIPDKLPIERTCLDRGCCWAPPNGGNSSDAQVDTHLNGRAAPVDIPNCYYASDDKRYVYTNVSNTEFGITAILEQQFASPYPGDVATLQMDVIFETENRLRVKIFDPNSKRYEPHIPVVPIVETAAETRNYDVVIDDAKTGFQVIRISDNTVIFNTQDVGSLIFADQFIQISAILPSHYIYGLGEHRDDVLLHSNWKRYTLFAHDTPPRQDVNLYGVHPYYLMMEETGNSHGVFLLNSNAMEVIIQPAPAITFRTLGGILDMYFFLGPSPSEVVQQYTELVGRPFMPPYWSLGFQLCRWGYNTSNKTREVWQRTKDAGIPFDVQWNDIDYMSHNNDFTYDHEEFDGLPELIDDIHASGMKWVPILDPGVSGAEEPGIYPPYDDAVDMDLLIRHQNGSIIVGKVWNDVNTVFPDYTHPRAEEYWEKQLRRLHIELPFDGLWIDMNEPSNFFDGSLDGCPESNYEDPPYVVGVGGGTLRTRTLCMTSQQSAGLHYNVHNLYGFSQAIVTNTALRTIVGKRPFIISRSTFSGQGKYTGHWSGDVASTWNDMRKSIPEILNFNMFGIPMVGADICGFTSIATVALCQRWQELGAFYPFSRNHNMLGTPDQDPVALGPEVVDATIKSLTIRYSLLPYLYTLFWDAHTRGSTVARPLFFEFPQDSQTYNISTQFLWGSGLMIIPALEVNITEREAYFPAGRWFDYHTGHEFQSSSEGALLTVPAPLDTIPLYVRGGYVLPMQVPSQTTTESRNNDFELLVALDTNGNADGFLYWDDGETIDTYENGQFNRITFRVEGGQLNTSVDNSGYDTNMALGKVTILGVDEVNSVQLRGINTPFLYDAEKQVLTVEDIKEISLTTPLTLTWT